jgi:hypothetical protein
MTSRTWYEPPDGVAPMVGDVLKTPLGKLKVIEILDQRGPRWLLRLQGDDPQPCE